MSVVVQGFKFYRDDASGIAKTSLTAFISDLFESSPVLVATFMVLKMRSIPVPCQAPTTGDM
jgi:hypothetical protein